MEADWVSEADMKMVILILFGVALIVLFGVVWLNRESSAVMNATLPVAVGALSALWLVFAFAEDTSVKRTFPASFFIQRSDNLPIALTTRRFQFQMHQLAAETRQQRPEVFNSTESDHTAMDAYHELLQRALVDLIASRHFGTWRMEFVRFESGSTRREGFQKRPDADGFKSRILSASDLEQAFGSNRFARAHTGFGTWAIPRGTSLIVESPQPATQTGLISLENWLCHLRIETQWSDGGVGVGAYAGLVGFNQVQAQERFWHHNFIVKLSADFSPYLIGHPEMTAHREWVEGILALITNEFDEERLWQLSKDDYLLGRQTTDSGIQPPTMAPMQLPAAPARDQRQ